MNSAEPEPHSTFGGCVLIHVQDRKLQLLSLFTLANVAMETENQTDMMGASHGSPPNTASSRPNTGKVTQAIKTIYDRTIFSDIA